MIENDLFVRVVVFRKECWSDFCQPGSTRQRTLLIVWIQIQECIIYMGNIDAHTCTYTRTRKVWKKCSFNNRAVHLKWLLSICLMQLVFAFGVSSLHLWLWFWLSFCFCLCLFVCLLQFVHKKRRNEDNNNKEKKKK